MQSSIARAVHTREGHAALGYIVLSPKQHGFRFLRVERLASPKRLRV